MRILFMATNKYEFKKESFNRRFIKRIINGN